MPRAALRRIGTCVLALDETDSTNTELLRRAAGLPDGSVVVAEYQTRGRGRRGRHWLAPRGASILLSVMLKEAAGSPVARRATILGALAACEAIEQATVCKPAVRWPNDVTIAGRKISGVLVETTPCDGGQAVIIGIGINCLQQAGHFPPALTGRATSLEIESPLPIDRAAVTRALLARLDGRVVELAQDAAASPDFRLAVDSPCINAGTNQPDWMAAATDLDGSPRIDRVFGTVDIGAYEYHYTGSLLLLR
jgi:BirA family biotin operon repressor/biotin-[acetyl-CoA-carboxylase] ligase